MTNANVTFVYHTGSIAVHTRCDGYQLGIALKLYDAITEKGKHKRNVQIENLFIATNAETTGIGFDTVETEHSYTFNMCSDESIKNFIETAITNARTNTRIVDKEDKKYFNDLSLYMDDDGVLYTGELKNLRREQYEEKEKSYSWENPNRIVYKNLKIKMEKLERII